MPLVTQPLSHLAAVVAYHTPTIAAALARRVHAATFSRTYSRSKGWVTICVETPQPTHEALRILHDTARETLIYLGFYVRVRRLGELELTGYYGREISLDGIARPSLAKASSSRPPAPEKGVDVA
jgi:hypothetical protein